MSFVDVIIIIVP